jgi:hypothetical protein
MSGDWVWHVAEIDTEGLYVGSRRPDIEPKKGETRSLKDAVSQGVE